MYQLTLFIFCLAFLAAAGGAAGLGLLLGALAGGLGMLTFAWNVWAMLRH